MRKSLLVTWIANNDYPLFRAWLEKYHSWFDEIIICWDIAFRFPFYNAFIQQSLSHIENIKFLDCPPRDLGIDDWRNQATNYSLAHASGDWICSIEQDWFSKDWPRLLEKTQQAMNESELTGWLNPTIKSYFHPAYWFMKRELINRIGADFGPHSEINGCDHFGMMTYKAQDINASIHPIQEYGIKTEIATPDTTDVFHLGGVNQNYLDFEQRLKSNTIHREQIFYVYNYWSMKANVPQNPEFMERMKLVDATLRSRNPQINPETDGWNNFFK